MYRFDRQQLSVLRCLNHLKGLSRCREVLKSSFNNLLEFLEPVDLLGQKLMETDS
jgi:hypothetical protein